MLWDLVQDGFKDLEAEQLHINAMEGRGASPELLDFLQDNLNSKAEKLENIETLLKAIPEAVETTWKEIEIIKDNDIKRLDKMVTLQGDIILQLASKIWKYPDFKKAREAKLQSYLNFTNQLIKPTNSNNETDKTTHETKGNQVN